jgi:hypothetical protein
VGDAINQAIAYWKFRRFWFNEVFDTGTMTAQDGTIPLGSQFLVPATDYDGFVIEYASSRYPLNKVTQQVYDGYYQTNGYGLPTMYARIGQDYEVYPLPDQAYTIKRHYLKEYTALTTDGATNDFTTYADRLITLWTLANMSAEFRQDDKMETYYRAASDTEFNNLCVMTDKSNASGQLTINSSLTTYW